MNRCRGNNSELAEEVADELKQAFQMHTFAPGNTRTNTLRLEMFSLLAVLANNFSFITACAFFFVHSQNGKLCSLAGNQ